MKTSDQNYLTNTRNHVVKSNSKGENLTFLHEKQNLFCSFQIKLETRLLKNCIAIL